MHSKTWESSVEAQIQLVCACGNGIASVKLLVVEIKLLLFQNCCANEFADACNIHLDAWEMAELCVPSCQMITHVDHQQLHETNQQGT